MLNVHVVDELDWVSNQSFQIFLQSHLDFQKRMLAIIVVQQDSQPYLSCSLNIGSWVQVQVSKNQCARTMHLRHQQGT